MNLNNRYQDTLHRPSVRIVEGLFGGLFIGAMVGVGIFMVTKKIAPDLVIPAQFPILDTLSAYVFSLFGHHRIADDGMTWQQLSAQYPAWTHALTIHLYWSTGVAAVASVGAGILLGKPRPYERHLRGRQLIDGKAAHRAAKESEKNDIKRTGAGVFIHPLVQVSEERERRSFAIVGSPGGGKTTVIMPVMVQAKEREDKVITYDAKGSFTERLPGDFLLIAPWDKRGIAWAICKDCLSGADARELAARLVIESSDPMWSNAARLILTGLIVHLQQTGKPWGWEDLSVLLNLPIEGLQEIIVTSYPEAWRPVEVASRTTQSILITLASYMAQIHDMARVWGNAEDGFSITEFLSDDYQGIKTLILQGNKKFTEMQNAIVNGMMAMASAHINSPALPDSTSRRIWLFLDEAPQLKKAEWIQDIVAVGRSKGVRTLIGVQDVAQLRQIYGRDQTESWTSMIGTYVFTQIGGNDTAKWIADFVGEREVERYEKTVTNDTKQVLSSSTQSVESYRRMKIRVIEPDEMQTLLGPEKNGVQALLHLGDSFEYLLLWPYSHLMYPVIRPAWDAAEWVGKPPPQVQSAEKPEDEGMHEDGVLPEEKAEDKQQKAPEKIAQTATENEPESDDKDNERPKSKTPPIIFKPRPEVQGELELEPDPND